MADEVGALVAVARPVIAGVLQIFHEGWRIVQDLCARNFEMPSKTDVPSPVHREVARIFVERREFPVPDVIEAIRKFAQPELLTSSDQTVSNVPFGTSAAPVTSTIIAPIARTASVA